MDAAELYDTTATTTIMLLTAAAATTTTIDSSTLEATAVDTATAVANPVEYAIMPILQRLCSWHPTFMQGFILGQISMLVLLGMAIKYLLFEEPLGRKNGDESLDKTNGESTGTVVQEGGFGLSKFMIFSRKPKEPKPTDLAEELTKMRKEILSRTNYNLPEHPPESCDWLTVFLAQIIAKFRVDAERHGRLVRVISEALNGELRPTVIDNIRITQFSLGSDFLRIVSARMVPSSGSLGMRAELDLALHDELTLGFNTRVLVNWPRTSIAALPVTMVVSLVKFVGTVAIEFDSVSAEPSVSITILPDYVLEFDVQTLIGSKAKVQNLPMLTSVISRKLQAAFAKELVMPNEKRIRIKHPFTPKSQSSTTSTSTTTGSKASTSQQQQSQPQQPEEGVPSTAKTNRPSSPKTQQLLADLPPDYNTQLPPPHHMRSGANSRTTTTEAAATISASASTQPAQQQYLAGAHSPLLRAARGSKSRMFTPEGSIISSSSAYNTQQQQYQRPWSPEILSAYHGSPHLQPIFGLAAAASSTTGRRKSDETIYSDDLRVKDSVRQRVNRVIRTVNES